MNSEQFRKNVPLIATSPEEYEAFVRYIKAKKDHKRFWTFEFNICKSGEVKPIIKEVLK